MTRTFINTPIVSPCLHAIAIFFAWLLRWKMPSEVPDLKKAIFIGAPHTSNWDFFVMMMAVLIYRLDIKWVGKHTLFKGPMGPIARWFGGIPIDRTVRHHFVDQMVDHFNHTEKTLLVIAPEGTRKPVENWHKGFYYMAINAHIPIVLTYMDYKKREVGIGAVEIPSGNIEEDMLRYRKFYATKTGKNPRNYHGYIEG